VGGDREDTYAGRSYMFDMRCHVRCVVSSKEERWVMRARGFCILFSVIYGDDEAGEADTGLLEDIIMS